MRLIEADAKMLLRRRGLPVPRGRLYEAGETIEAPASGAAVKAQILGGARGKRGLVCIARQIEVQEAAEAIAARMAAIGLPTHILVEENIAFEAEYYLAWRIDDVRQAPTLMFSHRGGIDVEAHSDAICEHIWNPLNSLHPYHLLPFLLEAGAANRAAGALARFASDLYRLFVAEDAELIEINPLAVMADGQIMALDAKIVLDDNARFRHRDWTEWLSTKLEQAAAKPLELRAAQHGLTLVEMDGCVALFAAGAGFGMSLVDILGDAGLPAANFADASGGSSAEAFAAMGEVIMECAARPEVKAVVCFQTMGAVSLKTAVDGLLSAADRAPVKKPFVVGFVVSAISQREMTAIEARALFAARGHHLISDLDELVPALRAIIQP